MKRAPAATAIIRLLDTAVEIVRLFSGLKDIMCLTLSIALTRLYIPWFIHSKGRHTKSNMSEYIEMRHSRDGHQRCSLN